MKFKVIFCFIWYAVYTSVLYTHPVKSAGRTLQKPGYKSAQVIKILPALCNDGDVNNKENAKETKVKYLCVPAKNKVIITNTDADIPEACMSDMLCSDLLTLANLKDQ